MVLEHSSPEDSSICPITFLPERGFLAHFIDEIYLGLTLVLVAVVMRVRGIYVLLNNQALTRIYANSLPDISIRTSVTLLVSHIKSICA